MTAFEVWRPWAIALVLTIISGLGDAQGFLHAARVWQAGRLIWSEVAASAAGFGFGIAVYWVAVRFYQQVGVTWAEAQTIFWFAVTLIGVALVSGKFAQWAPAERLVALAVAAGIGWLLLRTGG